MAGRNGSAAVVALAVWLGPAAAVAAPSQEPFRLSFVRGERTEACFEQKELAARVSARLGKDPFSNEAPRSIEAVIARDDAGWTARIFVRAASGELVGSRTLED